MAAKKTSTKKSAKKKAPAKKKAAKASAPVVRKAVAAELTEDEAAEAEDEDVGDDDPADPSELAEDAADDESADTPEKKGGAAADATKLLAGEGGRTIPELGDDLISDKKSVAANAARILEAVLEQKPEAVVPVIERLTKAVVLADKRPAQCAANALPVMAKVAPARVARHLPRLKDGFDHASPIGKDGLVRTFAALCIASVAYQKRLEGVLNKALGEADAKTLMRWTEIVLPALKGEPHARARATVEGRLDRIPKAAAQKIADFLGIKLRLRYR